MTEAEQGRKKTPLFQKIILDNWEMMRYNK